MTEESERSSTDGDSDAADGTVNAQYDWSSIPPSAAVVRTLSIALDREEQSLDPLYESIDSDALDALFQPTLSPANTNGITVSFTAGENQVTVRDSGEVIVRPVR
ncbi:HalOD1 output domain-containing protein [Halobellus rufus]|uniref:HalOD1 output domain-containing protein n=1 Tax=Halobellus rufus TaxID=1448860 RepID=UPI000679C0C0|nr:HalOD1 output domain-containing protein [Halobellus rufus]